MNKQMRWIFLLVLLLALAGLACNAITGGGNEPAADAASAATAEPGSSDGTQDGAQADAPVVEGPQSLDLQSLGQGLVDVNSYRVTLEVRFEGTDATGAPATASMMANIASVVDPPASEATFEISGVADLEEVGGLSIIQVGDQVYTTLPGLGCISGAAADLGAEANPFGDLLSSNDLLGEISGAKRVLPDETINGVATYHYTFDETVLDDPNNEIDQVDGHIYVAKEGGYLVRMVMDGVGRIDIFGDGTDQTGNIHIELNSLDVNQPIDIQPPADCQSFDFEIPDFAAQESPYPVYEGNTDLFVFDDITSYQVVASIADVVAFYRAEMPAAGYTELVDRSFVSDTAAVLYFSLNDKVFVVTISDSEGTLYVQVVPE